MKVAFFMAFPTVATLFLCIPKVLRDLTGVQVFDVSHAVHFSASRSRAARAPTTEGGMLLPPVDTLLPEVVLAPLRVIGGEGRGPGRFCGPYDTAVARSRLIVSEFEGRRVQVRISTTSAAIDEPRPPLTG